MIEIIEIDGYLDTLKQMSPTSGGESAQTFLATVEWSDGTVMDTYVKLFPASLRTKELINESFGFLLAETAQLRQTQRAALIKLAVDDFSIDTSTDSFALTNGYVYGWATASLGGDNLKKLLLKNPPSITATETSTLMQMLSKWPSYYSLISFDYWTGNTDRNIGNLIFIDQNNLAIIDHGRLFGVVNWLVENFDADVDCQNIMLYIYKLSHAGAIIHPARYKPILDAATQQQLKFNIAVADIKQEIIRIDSVINSQLNSKIDDFFDYFHGRFANIASRLPLALAA
ncbi:hypothetical protein [Acinetobacter bereziniae]|uniref:hypothetical protein n=1 Tax=Acinetobacter bereziniae TaxID=106648 RepID=UPI0029542281|nr:hypothetical protein [Acinetobacter bereziniae]MDV8157470.1 hypothetical protein [Acinetobacter bereziniae]